jgi:hypothetical protein
MQSSGRLAVFLLLIGGVAAFAALFAPAGSWLGVDAGAVGASVFTLALLATIGLFATRGHRVFPEDLSISERRAWLGLIFTTLVLSSFGRHLWALWTHGSVPGSARDLFAHGFPGRLFALIIAWAVLWHLVGRAAGGVETDERDLRLRYRADRAGDRALTLIVIAAIVVLGWSPAWLEWWLAPVVLANLLVGLLIARSLVEHAALTLAYRRARQ